MTRAKISDNGVEEGKYFLRKDAEMNQTPRSYEAFHVFQIALSVAMSVFLVALYVHPTHLLGNVRGREVRTQQTIYLMEVKYLSSDRKPASQQMRSDEKPAL